MSRINIPGGPIKPGFRRLFNVRFDESVDELESGGFLSTESVEGDSTITVLESTADGAKIAINGDGSVGDKVVALRVDGHVGPGDVEIVQELGWSVGSPDATAISISPAGAPDEPIPTTPVPEPA